MFQRLGDVLFVEHCSCSFGLGCECVNAWSLRSFVSQWTDSLSIPLQDPNTFL